MSGRVHAAFAIAAMLATAVRATPPLPPLYTPPLPTRATPAATRLPQSVALLGDVTYATIPGFRPLKLDLYLPDPKNSPGRRPLVVWIHGGGFELGNPRADWTYGDWTRVLARLAARGYVVAAVSYRLSGEAPFPAQIDDVDAALRFLRDHARLWGIDADRTLVWGLSAGATLAALVDTRSAVVASAPKVVGAVDWFGVSDVATMPMSDTIAHWLGCGTTPCTAALMQAASPVSYASAKTPPMLIVHGDADHIVPVVQSQLFYDRLKRLGAPVELTRLPGLNHGFVGASPAKLDTLLEQVFAFVDSVSATR